MTLEEKLERVLELVRQRDEITAQLNALIGGESSEPKMPSVRDEGKDKARKNTDSTSPKKRASGAGRYSPKECCGSTGPRHLKTCPQSSAATSTTESATTILDEPKRLSESEYDEVREQLEDGLKADNIVFSYPHIEISEIRKVSKSESYEEYLKT